VVSIDDPVFSIEGSQPGGKDFWLSEEGEVSVETELAVTEGLLEGVDKLSAKNLTQHLARKKELLGCGVRSRTKTDWSRSIKVKLSIRSECFAL
jgi:hypothetical protein